MKKLIAFLSILAILALVAAAPNPQSSGIGWLLQVTATNARVALDPDTWIYSLSVNNTSAETVYVLVNCSAADFITAKAASPATVVSIPAGSSYTFTDRAGTRKITSFAYDASGDTGSANVYFAGY